MNLYKTLFIAIVISMILCACGGNDDQPPAPTPTLLIFPEANSECTTGISLNTTQSRVTFSWEASDNTDNYKLDISNLENSITESYGTNGTSFEVALTKGAPYSWTVTSRSDQSSKTAISETWYFYNAGEGINSYAPFPAEVVYPELGDVVFPSEGNLILQWNGADVDNDIASYNIYFDTVNPPVATVGNSINTVSFQVSSLLPSTVYYWQVDTIDSEGNISTSEVFQFMTTE